VQTLELDGSTWTTVDSFHKALLSTLGAPFWHGRSVDAFIDSMIYGGINALEPPYQIRVTGVARAPADLRAEIELLSAALAQARSEYASLKGRDIEVRVDIAE
jgi:hypothetical protein